MAQRQNIGVMSAILIHHHTNAVVRTAISRRAVKIAAAAKRTTLIDMTSTERKNKQ